MIASDIINRAFRLLNITASGEAADAGESLDALKSLNTMIAAWMNESSMYFSNPQLSYTAPSARTSFTIGPTGDLVSTHSVQVGNVFLRVGTLDYPVEQIGQTEYQEIALKSLTSGYPSVFWYAPSVPNATVYLWPGLSAGQTLFVGVMPPMDVFPTLSATVDMPASYEKMLAYNLALDIADEYGVDPSANIKRTAAMTKKAVKRTNTEVPKMASEAAFLSSDRGRINILSGR